MKEKTALEYLSIAFDIAKDNYGILFLNYLIYSLILFLLIISYVGILAIPLIYAGYFIFVLGYRPSKMSWLKVFLYSQVLLLGIHILNFFIGGSANYFFTMEPPIANNLLIIGTYPTHIIMMDFFALIHFYFLYMFIGKFLSKN